MRDIKNPRSEREIQAVESRIQEVDPEFKVKNPESN